MSDPSLLIAASDDALAAELGALLLDLGVNVRRVRSEAEVFSQLDELVFDILIVEHSVSANVEGFTSTLAERAPELSVIVLVGLKELGVGVAAVRSGATDFLRTPLERDEVAYVVKKALKGSELSLDEPPPSMRVSPTTVMLGTSPAMQELRRTLAKAASGVATVLVRGESGSGKELVARQLHELSPRRSGPFVKVHSGALPETLLESELFGYEKGAFTGATSRKPGRVELAEGGSLFLDEIGDISPATQVKLLRILQDKQYERLGGTESLSADVRFVAATHRDLEALVKEGKFREDLFYRLNVVALWVPPLSARPSDIEPLALHFCEKVAQANGRGTISLDADAIDLLAQQPWPGNVRQLQNFIERLVVLASGPRISRDAVQRELQRQEGPLGFAVASGYDPKIGPESSVIDLGLALRKAERHALDKALKSASGNRNLAARLLGISRRSLYYKLQEHGIGKDEQ